MSEYTELAQQSDDRYRQEIEAKVAVGLDAEAFLDSKLGQYMVGRARDTAQDAMEALKHVDPNDALAIRALQNQVFRAESFEIWMNECRTEGEVAQNQLTTE